MYEDTCLVYLITDGDRGVLVDCGSGGILTELAAAGIDRIDWVLHTHHHRDQCGGAHFLAEHGASLAVPEREAHLFAAVEQFWDSRQGTHRYDLATDWFTLAESVPVAAVLADYGTFQWRSHGFRIFPGPGHTRGGIILVLDVDGRTVAFTGDLISSKGRIPSVAALQWSYGGGVGILDGVQPAVHALSEVQREGPQLLLPSHGSIVDQPEASIGDAIKNLRSLVRFQEADANEVGMSVGPVGLVTDRNLLQLSDHLWMNRYAFANSYFLVSENGNVLLMDYGYPTFHHFTAGFRFAEHSLRELEVRGRAKKLDLVIPSHYHDDHIAGIPYLQRRYGVRVWAHEVMAGILEKPGDYRLPCLLPDPIQVECSLRDGETFEWEEFTVTVIHTPGHTYYHSALCFEVDGLRVAFTGDTIHAGATGPILGGPIYQNRFRLGDFTPSIDRLQQWNPQLLLTGHTGAAEVDAAWLDIAQARARAGDTRLEALSPPRALAETLDPFWIGLHPYEQTIHAGEEFELAAQARNNGSEATLILQLIAPEGWIVEPLEAVIRLPAETHRATSFRVRAPDDWSGSHTSVLCADVTVHDMHGVRQLGQICEALARPALRPGTRQFVAEEAEELLGGVAHVAARSGPRAPI